MAVVAFDTHFQSAHLTLKQFSKMVSWSQQWQKYSWPSPFLQALVQRSMKPYVARLTLIPVEISCHCVFQKLLSYCIDAQISWHTYVQCSHTRLTAYNGKPTPPLGAHDRLITWIPNWPLEHHMVCPHSVVHGRHPQSCHPEASKFPIGLVRFFRWTLLLSSYTSPNTRWQVHWQKQVHNWPLMYTTHQSTQRKRSSMSPLML